MNTGGLVRIGLTGVLLAATTAFGVIGGVRAASPGAPSSFVPITPCRMVDTRATETVGTRSTPIGPSQAVTFNVWGTNGNCTIPNTAVGIVTNTTAVNPTDSSFLTVWPADASQPLTSNLNWIPTSPPTPNQVTVGLSATGAVNVFNKHGSVDVIIDIVGYYLPTPTPTPTTTPTSTTTTTTTTTTTPPFVQEPPDVYVATRGTVNLSATGGLAGATTINSMFLPAGTYLVTFTATLVNFSAASDFFRCSIYNSGALVAGNTVRLGPTADSITVAPMTVQAVVTLTFAGTTAVGSTCLHDSNLPAGSYYLDPGATLTALPVTNLSA